MGGKEKNRELLLGVFFCSFYFLLFLLQWCWLKTKEQEKWRKGRGNWLEETGVAEEEEEPCAADESMVMSRE